MKTLLILVALTTVAFVSGCATRASVSTDTHSTGVSMYAK